MRVDRLPESGSRAARHQPVRPRLAAHRHVEDRRPEAGSRPSSASTPPSAARGATRRSPAPRSASSPSVRPIIAGTRRLSGRSCGICTTCARPRARASGCSRSRIGPSSTSGSTFISRTSRSCRCISRHRVRWCSATDCCSWSMTSASRCMPGEVPVERSVRFRTLGCYPLTGAIESTAATLPDVIREMLLATSSERQGRAIDHDQSASMEQKKQQGYF